MTDKTEEFRAYWADFARAFAYPLQEDQLLGRFVKNPAVTGAYAEAWIRETARSMLGQLRISRGAITRESDRKEPRPVVPECDLIVWDPSDLPAIFEKGEFAVVSNHAVRALIEIKRSCADPDELVSQLEQRQRQLLLEYRRNVFGVVFTHPKPLFTDELTPSWMLEIPAGDLRPRITRLFASETWEPDLDGIFAFIYFLSQVAGYTWPPKQGTWQRAQTDAG